MERKFFSFDISIFLIAKTIKKPTARCEFYEAVFSYALTGELPDLAAMRKNSASAFLKVKHQLDLGLRSAEDVRRSTEYKNWRAAVFSRDNYTCQLCGARGVKINAHHIKPFATFPDMRTDIDNGITLCVPCHKAVHHGS